MYQLTESVEQDILKNHRLSFYTGKTAHVLKNAISLYAVSDARLCRLKCIPHKNKQDIGSVVVAITKTNEI